MDPEAVIGPGLRSCVTEQFGQPFLAFRGDPVGDPGAPRTQRDGVDVDDGIFGGDVAGGLQPAQRGVERAEAEGTERTEGGVQPLTQFIAVHGRFGEQAKDGQLEDGGTFLDDGGTS